MKDFKKPATAGAGLFISALDTQGTQDTQNTARTYYRFNLKLDLDLKEFLSEEAWKQRMTITALINQILQEYKRDTELKK